VLGYPLKIYQEQTGVRWHIMNDGRREKTYWIISLGRFFESYAIGIITPGRLGEMIKAGHENSSNDKVNTLVRVISERGFDVGIFVFIAVLALFTGQFVVIESWILWLLALLSIGLIFISFMFLSSVKTLLFFQKLINKIPGKLSSLKLFPKKYKKGIASLIFILSVLSNLSYFISCYFLSLSVGLEIDIIVLSGGVAIAGLLNMLPITVMGLGTREITFISLFTMYGQSMILAFSVTMLMVAQLGGGLFSMLFGQILLIFNKREKRKN